MKKYLVVFLSLMLIFTLTACTDSSAEPEGVDQEDSDLVEEANKEEAEDKEDGKDQDKNTNERKKEVNLYFANEQYIETGDESLEKTLPRKKTIEYKDTSLEEAAVRALMVSDDVTEEETAIPKAVKLIDVKVKDKTALVNFAQEGLSGGSLQEVLTVEQIVQTLLDLETVDKVQFLIDGQESESLMGHLDTSQAFTE